MPVTTRAMARRSNMVMLNVTPAAARCVVAGGGADNICHRQNNIVTEYSREEYDKLSEDDPQLFPPVSDEEDEEVVEQHNVGECECKDCKIIEAEDDSDEESDGEISVKYLMDNLLEYGNTINELMDMLEKQNKVKEELKKENHELKLKIMDKEWKGHAGCKCYDCWKWCNMGSKEEYDIFIEKYEKLFNTEQ